MTFDAHKVLEETGGLGMQEGWNEVVVEEVVQKTSSRGNLLVAITLKGVGGKAWANFNINHPNPKADEIARRELAALMVACNVGSVRDPANPVELIGKGCGALLGYDGSFLRPKAYRLSEAAPVVGGMAAIGALAAEGRQEPAPSAAPGIDEDDIPFN